MAENERMTYVTTALREKNDGCRVRRIVTDSTRATVVIVALKRHVALVGRAGDNRQLIECQTGVRLPIGNGRAN